MKIESRKINQMMLITICVMVGIVVDFYWDFLVGSIVFWVVCTLCVAAALWWDIAKKQAIGILAIALIACGAILDRVGHSTDENIMPYDTDIAWSVSSLSSTEVKGKYAKLTAQAIAFKDTNRVWQPSRIKVELNIDTSLRVRPKQGNKIAFRGKLRSVEGSYGEWLARQGIVGKVYTYKAYITDSTASDSTLSQRVAALRIKMARKVEAIDTSQIGATTTMCALTLGERGAMPRELKDEYRRSGATHVLSISGMHVTMIVVMLSFLVGLVGLWRRGQIVLGSILIALLWIYALFTAMSPPVVRAVTMFTIYQIGRMSWRSSDGLSALSASALILLMIDTRYLIDPGFQLSFLAMLGIITLYRPISSLLRVGNSVARFVWSMTVISLSAQIAVAPLVVYYFGQLPLLGIVINLLIWITVPAIIVCTTLFLITSSHWIGMVGVWVAKVQNFTVAGIATPRWAAIEAIELSALWMLVIYLVLVASTIAINNLHNRKTRYSILKAKHHI